MKIIIFAMIFSGGNLLASNLLHEIGKCYSNTLACSKFSRTFYSSSGNGKIPGWGAYFDRRIECESVKVHGQSVCGWSPETSVCFNKWPAEGDPCSSQTQENACSAQGSSCEFLHGITDCSLITFHEDTIQSSATKCRNSIDIVHNVRCATGYDCTKVNDCGPNKKWDTAGYYCAQKPPVANECRPRLHFHSNSICSAYTAWEDKKSQCDGIKAGLEPICSWSWSNPTHFGGGTCSLRPEAESLCAAAKNRATCNSEAYANACDWARGWADSF